MFKGGRLNHFFKSPVAVAAGVFFLFFAIFLLFHSLTDGFFSGDDPYYHAKHSWLIAQTGDWKLVKPWIEFHWLSYAPTDPWWGYHLLGALTAKFFGLVWGAKVLAAFFAALALAVFYFIASRLGARSPIFWTFLFFTSSYVFLFRLFLERPFLAALFATPLIYWLTYTKKYWWIFILNFFFILFYNLAPLSLFFVAVFLAAEFFYNRRLDLKPLIAAGSGILAGIFVHPYSLNYLNIIFIHIWQVLYLRFKGVGLDIGGEVQSQKFSDFIISNFVFLVFFFLAVGLFFAFHRQFSHSRQRVVLASLFISSVFWALISMAVPRGVEYWLPFGCLFIAVIFSEFRKLKEFDLLANFLRKKLKIGLILFFSLSALLITTTGKFVNILFYIQSENNKQEYYYFSQVNVWLKENSQEGEIVFYTNWGFWPKMFFFNDYNRYLTGIDPTFLYEYSPDLSRLWRNIIKYGVYCDQDDFCPNLTPRQSLELLSPAFKERFKAKYILLTKEEPPVFLNKVIEARTKEFLKVYENQRMLIYKIL